VKIDLLTLFPEMLESALRTSILDRAQKQNLVSVRQINIRNFAQDKHRTVDDRPFGGGPGMVMKCEPLVEAIEHTRSLESEPGHVIYLTPEGKTFNQAVAQRLAVLPRLIFVSGHYEGIDERVREGWIDEELSIGDYVLTNGTIAALIVMDAVIRLIPGVLGNDQSSQNDSFAQAEELEGPQYTRPPEFRGKKVPEILLQGNHEAIANWRKEQARKRTRERRPRQEG
jgi:tRNA (guanine37-N1)-methyltransferase